MKVIPETRPGNQIRYLHVYYWMHNSPTKRENKWKLSKSTIYSKYSMFIIRKAHPYWSLAFLVLIFWFETVGQNCWKWPVIYINISNNSDRHLREIAEVTKDRQNCTFCTHWNAIPGIIMMLEIFSMIMQIRFIWSNDNYKNNILWHRLVKIKLVLDNMSDSCNHNPIWTLCKQVKRS